MSSDPIWRRSAAAEAALVFLVGGFWFGWLALPYPLPGGYVDHLAGALQNNAFVGVDYPMWSSLMAMLGPWTQGPFGGVANRWSGWMMAAAIGLLYLLMRRLPFDPDQEFEDLEEDARRLGARVAVGVAWVGVPFLDAGIHAGPEPLALILILGSFHAFLSYRQGQEGSALSWMLGWLFLGLANAEFAPTLWLTPWVGGWALYQSFRLRRLGWMECGRGVVAFATGGGLLAFRAILIAERQLAAGMEAETGFGLFAALWSLHREQAALFAQRTEFILLVLFTLVPFLLVYSRTASKANLASNRWNWQFLYPALLVVAAIQIMNLPGSPWMLNPRFTTVAFPYLFTCLWMGRLVGFHAHPVSKLPSPIPKGKVQRLLVRMGLPFLVVVLLHSGWKNQPSAERRELDAIGDFLQDIVATPHAEWIVADGMTDSLITLMSNRESGKGPRTINLTASVHPAYMTYLMEREGVEVRPDPATGKGSADAMFLGWLRGVDRLADRMVVVQWPEFLRDLRRSAFPLGPVYRGIVSSEEASRYARELDASLGYYKQWADRIESDRQKGPFRLRHSRWLHDSLSKSANNLGALFFRLNRIEAARVAWETSLRLSGGNTSARWNLYRAARFSGWDEAEVEAAPAELHALTLRWGDLVEVP
ncbi:MAG TPA: hypothetical protein PKE55_11690 [Kiritimatiellia bacterium]|nr:hypothetical protein [Kiritimatiellia bacterium]